MIRRLALVALALLTSLALGVSGLTAAWLAGSKIPFASGATYLTLQKVASAHYAGEPDGTVFVLLVGSDLRPGVGGARGDALHVVALNPTLKQGTIIDVPRDTCTYVPGSGTTKVNAAHAVGGPRLQADVLGTMLGVTIPYAVSVDFAGFQGLVDGVGGVTVNVPETMSDSYSGAYFAAGETHMNGDRALAFSRDRHDFATGDLKRSWNQGYLILSAIGQLREQVKDTAGKFGLLALLGRHAQMDGAGLTDLYRLGRLAYSVDPSQIKNVGLPVSSGGCAGGLTPNSDAPGLLADFADDGVLQTH